MTQKTNASLSGCRKNTKNERPDNNIRLVRGFEVQRTENMFRLLLLLMLILVVVTLPIRWLLRRSPGKEKSVQ